MKLLLVLAEIETEVEHLWKATKREEQRLHLKNMIMELNDIYKWDKWNKKYPKVLFDTIQALVSPAAPQVTILL